MNSKSTALALVFVFFTAMVSAQEICPPRISSPLTDEDFDLPECIPQTAATALQIAQKWQSDSALVRVEVNDVTRTGRFQVRFNFYSRSHGTGLWVADNRATPAGMVKWDTQPIPMNFLDLYAAVKKAREEGMDTPFDQAILYAWPDGIAWRISSSDDPDLRLFDIKAIQNTIPKKSNASWQTSWTEFVNEIQKLIIEDPSLTDFDSFVAKDVEWEGYGLTRMNYKEALDIVTVRMPEASLTYPDGRQISMKNPIQFITAGTAKIGESVRITSIYQEIRFRAKILDVHIHENQVIITLMEGKIES